MPRQRPPWCSNSTFHQAYCWMLEKLGVAIPPQPPIIPSDRELIVGEIVQPLHDDIIHHRFPAPGKVLDAIDALNAAKLPALAQRLNVLVPLIVHGEEAALEPSTGTNLLVRSFDARATALTLQGRRADARQATAIANVLRRQS